MLRLHFDPKGHYLHTEAVVGPDTLLEYTCAASAAGKVFPPCAMFLVHNGCLWHAPSGDLVSA